MKYLLTCLLIGFLSVTSGCKKDKPENWRTIKKLHNTFEDGRISECKHQGVTVYSVDINAYDAGSVVYDAEGDQIGDCNYAWGSVDQICNELEDCEVIYCPKDNIWGHPAVDKYGLD